MPKKTKKEKLIAQYRRKLQQLEGTPVQPILHTTVEPVSIHASQYVLPKNQLKREEAPMTLALPANEFSGIKKDLIKTLIVICLFFVIEITLWKLIG